MTRPKCQLFEDVYKAVYDDDYMWIVVWGPPRSSKTTLAGHILYSLYKDWNTVLNAFVYNLTQAIYKIRYGLPEKWPTTNGMHNRVPALNWDDFGAHSNKAATQREPAWDQFKGGFDTIGTKLGVLIATMVDPLEPTFQIMNKYTHEIEVLERGVYKYDKVKWGQDFRGWKPHTTKRNIETNTFDPWPDWVYRKYDETRQELVEEVFQRIDDASQDKIPFIVNLCQPIDFELLKSIVETGPLTRYEKDTLAPNEKKALIRMKARQLILPVPIGSSTGASVAYKYDITPLGLDVLNAFKKPQQLEQAKEATAVTEALKLQKNQNQQIQ